MQERLTTKEVCKILDISETTAYTYIKKRKLVPTNEKDWHIDQCYYFDPVQVEKLKEEISKPPGLTTGDVAKKLHIAPSTVSTYIKNGLLPAEQHLYKGRLHYFVKEEDLLAFDAPSTKQKREFYNKELGIGLFMKFMHPGSSKIARVMDIAGDEIVLVDHNGEKIKYQEAIALGFNPAYSVSDKKLIRKKGYLEFNIPMVNNVLSSSYSIFDLLYEYWGPANLRIHTGDEYISVEVKPSFIEIEDKETLNSETYLNAVNAMKEYAIEGKVKARTNGILLDTSYKKLYINLPEELKRKIKKAAEEKQVTMEELIVQTLEDRF